ncbi:WxL domain-containing protein [Enterococcus casseliflavus]|nr:WxL domain-containing protein [Enterococcus casseliflavus]
MFLRLKKIFSLLSILLLSCQMLQPITVFSTTTSQSTQETTTLTDELTDDTLTPDSSLNSEEELDDDLSPIITENDDTELTFDYDALSEKINELFWITFTSNVSMTEINIYAPDNISIVSEQLSSGETSEKNDQGWTVYFEKEQTSYRIPFISSKSGIFTVTIEEQYDISVNISNDTLNNVAGETVQSTEEVDSSIAGNSEELSTTSSTDVEQSSDLEISTFDESNVQDVATWEEFIRAFADVSITTINITADFVTPTNPRLNLTDITTGTTTNTSGGATYVYLSPSSISRTLVIEGNNHQLDFRSVALCFSNTTANSSNPWNVTLSNIEIYHGNYYGPITFNDLNPANQTASSITYQNITNIGNQLIHSPYSSVYLSGTTSSRQVSEYTSSFGTWKTIATDQTNIYASNLTILEDANIILETIGAGNLDLGAVTHPNNNFTMEKNSKLEATSNGSGGEADGVSLLVRQGDVIVEDGAEMILTPQSLRSAVSLRVTGASLTIDEESSVIINSSGTKSNANGYYYNVIWMAAGSILEIANGGKLDITAVDMGTSTSSIIYVNGNATFSVAKDGILDVKSDSTSQSQYLLYFASAGSTFEFSDADHVNLERTATISGTATTNGLIYIAGSGGKLQVDVQNVQLWNRDNFTSEPDFAWLPIFNLSLSYAGNSPTISSVSSIEQTTVDTFQQNFTTKNVQRVLFEKIADVEVSINELTADKTQSSSHVITGTATPNSVLYFSGDSAIPEGTIISPDVSSSTMYHTMADENGEYRYELPDNSYFTEGNEVTVFAFLNGKSAEASTIVSAIKKPPLPVDPLDPETEVTPENQPQLPEDQGAFSIDFVSSFDFGSQSIAVSDKTYYAKAQQLISDDTSNVSETRPNYIQITDQRSKEDRGSWQLAVTQNQQFMNTANDALEGAAISLFNQQLTSTNQNDPPEIAQTDSVELIPGVQKILLNASSTEGVGTWIYRFGDGNTAEESVSLFVPASASPDADKYTSTLSWQLRSVPENN